MVTVAPELPATALSPVGAASGLKFAELTDGLELTGPFEATVLKV